MIYISLFINWWRQTPIITVLYIFECFRRVFYYFSHIFKYLSFSEDISKYFWQIFMNSHSWSKWFINVIILCLLGFVKEQQWINKKLYFFNFIFRCCMHTLLCIYHFNEYFKSIIIISHQHCLLHFLNHFRFCYFFETKTMYELFISNNMQWIQSIIVLHKFNEITVHHW